MSNPGAVIVARMIPQGSVGVEIGVWNGESSAQFLKRTSHLHLVDPWVGRDDQYRKVKARFANLAVTIHRCKSEKFFAAFKGLVDWVYVDGAHDYETVLSDLQGAARILKPGGVIYGDDYGHRGGVKEAVDEFASVRKRECKLLGLVQYAIA